VLGRNNLSSLGLQIKRVQEFRHFFVDFYSERLFRSNTIKKEINQIRSKFYHTDDAPQLTSSKRNLPVNPLAIS
jgi:hypothetical protein